MRFHRVMALCVFAPLAIAAIAARKGVAASPDDSNPLAEDDARILSEVRDHSVEQGETASRHSEAAVIRCLDGPLVAQNGNPFWIERPTSQRAVTRRIDAFDKTQAHQKIFVGSLTRCELFFDSEAAAAVFHAHKPGFGPPLSCGRHAAAINCQSSMRTGADSGIVVSTPVDEVVSALGAGSRVI